MPITRKAMLPLAILLALSWAAAAASAAVDVSSIGQAKQMQDGVSVRVSNKLASTGKADFVVGVQFGPGASIGTVKSSLINEASGIAASKKNPGVYWVHNDSGDSARVYAMTSSGTHLGVYNLSGVTATDCEDIASGPGPTAGKQYVYLGDIGDNSAIRTSIRIYRVEEPLVSATQSPVTVTLTGVRTITLVYEDGPRDAETLMIDPVTGDLYIVSKRESLSRLYRASAADIATGSTVTLRFKGTLPFGWATGGDISPKGDEMIVRGYANASLWKRPPGSNLWDALKGTAYTVPFVAEPQGEAVGFAADGQGYYTVSEGLNQPIYYFPRQTPAISYFYLQEPNGFSGIKVLPTGGVGATLDRGKRVTVTGDLSTAADGQRQLTNAVVTTDASMPVVTKPVGMPGWCVGGADWYYTGAAPKAGQQGIAGGSGLNNIGNLVRIWGKIAEIDPTGAYFLIDDGSGTPIAVSHDGRAYSTGQYLVLTGISSCYRGTDNLLHTVLLPRTSDDIQSP